MKRCAAIAADDRIHFAVLRDASGDIAVHRQIGGIGFNAVVSRFCIEARKLRKASPLTEPRVEIDVRRAF